MFSVQEAETIIFEQIAFTAKCGEKWVPLHKAKGKILGEDLHADRDFPPFDRVAMDGIALRFQDIQNDNFKVKIVGTQAAGQPQTEVLNPENVCFEVMTGAVLPKGFDTVVRYEDLKVSDDGAEIDENAAKNIILGQNIHKKASDRRAGDVLILRGCKIGGAEIATAATIGLTHLKIVQPLEVAIVSTGDELVDIGETPLPHQIRRSNVYAVAALLGTSLRMKPKIFHFTDDKELITKGLGDIFRQFDVVVLSGAVSAGKFDFVPEVLEKLGVKKLFHQVAQRPGKPFWFGRLGEKAVFALPGNPVSTFLCACRYVVPFLSKKMGVKTATMCSHAQLAQDFTFKPPLTYFLQVKIENKNGLLLAHPLEGGGSGDLANLNDSDGFLELPDSSELFKKGETYRFWSFR